MPVIWICIFGMCVAQGEGYAQHTHTHTHTLKQDTHTCIHCDIYIHTYTYRQLWKVDIESDQILYSAFYFLYLCVKDFCIITRIYNCI